MKIAFVLYRYSEYGGGVQSYVARLARGLKARGHEVHLFAHRFEPSEPEGLNSHKVPALSFYSPLQTLSFAYNSASMLRAKCDFDVIQGFGRTFYQDVYRLGSGVQWEYLKRTKRCMNRAWLSAVHRLNPRNLAIFHLERKTFSAKELRLIVCNSEMGKKELMHYYGLPEERLRVIYNSVDAERYHPKNRVKWREETRVLCEAKADELLGLFVGHGTERKGIDQAILAVSMASKEYPVRLAIVGPCHRRYINLAKKLNAPVKFFEYQKEIEKFYAAADFFLFPTRYEGFANVCMEAMASGLAVITTTRSGLAEIIEDGKEGLIIQEEENLSEIVKKMSQVKDASLREAIGNAARRKAETFTEKRNLDEVEAVYREIVNRKKADGRSL